MSNLNLPSSVESDHDDVLLLAGGEDEAVVCIDNNSETMPFYGSRLRIPDNTTLFRFETDPAHFVWRLLFNPDNEPNLDSKFMCISKVHGTESLYLSVVYRGFGATVEKDRLLFGKKTVRVPRIGGPIIFAQNPANQLREFDVKIIKKKYKLMVRFTN